MKLKSLIIFACAAFAAAGCGQSNGLTKVTGTVPDESITEVRLVSEKYELDETLPVVDGKFSTTVPADPTEIAVLAAGGYYSFLIMDGTKITVSVGENPAAVSSSKNSLQNRNNEFEASLAKMNNDFVNEAMLLSQSEDNTEEETQTLLEELSSSAVDGIVEFVEQVIYDNRDNALAALALNKLIDVVPDEQLAYLITTLSEEMQQSSFIAPLQAEIDIKLSTAEGKPFTDFTIDDADGKTVSLSDYVGKGKYVLVDFWASWCVPCKEEIPNIKAVYNKYRRKGLDVLSVAVWDEPQATKDTAKAYGIAWNQIVNAGQIPTDAYGISSIPHIILFGPDGTILKRNLRGEEIGEEIAKYIK